MLVHLLLKFLLSFILGRPFLLGTSRWCFSVKHDNLITEELCNIIYNEAYFTFMACLCAVSPPNHDSHSGDKVEANGCEQMFRMPY